jgi:anti-sigma regulatory factor (Ser/Thr protein kinase)
MIQHHVILKNDLLEIQRLAQTIVTFGKTFHLSREIVHDLNLVLEEVISNTILYGYEDTNTHQIDVQISLQGQMLILQIKDDGKPFNPLEAPDPDIEKPIEEREIGGLGIYLVRRLMDELAYKREDGENVLVMKKQL